MISCRRILFTTRKLGSTINEIHGRHDYWEPRPKRLDIHGVIALWDMKEVSQCPTTVIASSTLTMMVRTP